MFKPNTTKIQLTRVAIGEYKDLKDVYSFRLKVKRLDSNLELKNIEYVVKFYNQYGEEIKTNFVNSTEPAKFIDENPGFFADESLPTWEGEHNLQMKEKPASLKIWIKRYMTKDGNVKNFIK